MPQFKKIAEAATHHTKITDWSVDERPREKLEKHGAATLSDSELLAILIGSGTQKITAVDLAKTLLRQFSTLANLAKCNYHELSQFKGIGKVKAIKLITSFEMARRLQSFVDEKKMKIASPDDVVRQYGPLLRDLNKEVFKVILLDGANQIIRDVTISEGTLTASLVHPREVFKAALDEHAAAVILLHNHPSGHTDPSAEDISITRQLEQAGKIMGIPVRDHIIIAGRSFASLAKLGYL
ncbi:DNA repair protein RadC [bacterium]|nr:DNA repair protein RadC [bacterium]